MTTPTPKRIAASILLGDMEIITDYWVERYKAFMREDNEDLAREIQSAMDLIVEPFLHRLESIAKDVSVNAVNDDLESKHEAEVWVTTVQLSGDKRHD